MLFRQFIDYESFTYTYLIASGRGREAILIDPVLEQVEQYIKLIKQLDLKLVKAIDTHVHADHITGIGLLQQKVGCQSVLGEQTKAECVTYRVKEDELIEFDGLMLKALYTPGHTDDSYSFLLDGRVFTGDTLLIRGTGRTDFQNGCAKAQYDSLFNKLLKLPEKTLVYPAHDYQGQTVSTIGEEKQFNPRLQVSSVSEYETLMNNLNLPYPKKIDIAVPANLHCGLDKPFQ